MLCMAALVVSCSGLFFAASLFLFLLQFLGPPLAEFPVVAHIPGQCLALHTAVEGLFTLGAFLECGSKLPTSAARGLLFIALLSKDSGVDD